MFEFFFKYPQSVYSKGQLTLLAPWPVWALVSAGIIGMAVIAWLLWHRRRVTSASVQPAAVWAMQSLTLVILLLLLWQPALSISTLKPQQNVVAVIVDGSRSMAIQDVDGAARFQRAIEVLNSGVLKGLQEKFQVRLYRMGGGLERSRALDELKPEASATRIADALRQTAAESSGLPMGAVVMLTDGADNSGGVDLETLADLRRQRIPIHTIGFGREQMSRDIELVEADVPPRAIADSRIAAHITVRQRGYDNQKVRLTVKDGGRVLATQEVTLKGNAPQSEQVLFQTGSPGSRNLQISVEGAQGEENAGNNSLGRLINVANRKPKVLYFEGEPRWDYKFIRRAIEEDKTLKLVAMLRTTQNKIYRQGIENANELEQGFPSKVEELFAYDGIIIGSVEANSFTPTQQELIRNFVDRRGGGALFLGAKAGLGDGGYLSSSLAEVLPVSLPNRRGTFVREMAPVELTGSGRLSLITRMEERPEANFDRWKKLPQLADYQDVGTPKPGAVVLLEALPPGRGRLPLLITQNYGRGRTGVFATGGDWRWQMQQKLEDMSHETFWQQMVRWLVSDTQGRVIASTPKQVIADDTKVVLRAEVRDTTFLPSSDARVEARILSPNGATETVELKPDPHQQGIYSAEWGAIQPGAYIAEMVAMRGPNNEEAGRDVVSFRREDGVAENFRAEQNRELLEKLSAYTGGRYYTSGQGKKLLEEISYSEAGITIRETRDLWNMPIVFLGLIGLRAGEWLLRRKWGVV